MLVIATLAVLALALLYLAERVRRRVVDDRRRRAAEQRLRTAMQKTDNRLAHEKAKHDQAAALTRVVPAIREHDTRHVA